MHKKGFGLLELLIAVAFIAVVAGSGFYIKSLKNKNEATQAGIEAEQQAVQAVRAAASATAQENLVLNEVSGVMSTPILGATSNSIATGVVHASSSIGIVRSVSADPLAGLGSNIYANGILPLGDGKYVTSGPKKGYVYLCNVAQGGEGAQENGPWIGTSTWNNNTKISVAGAISWPNASVSISVTGNIRTIITHNLPTIGTTGIFPIGSTDPAYQYDANPNAIASQNLSFSLPADPVAGAAPSCIYGEVGVMTNGVVLLDSFDEEYRDAAAHEIQDSCDGHPHEGGVYHYHSLSSCIPNATVTNIIGWAFDGFPITGPEVSSGRYLTTADLDECHGITSPVMLNGTLTTMYHYVMTQDFPYSVSCFMGKSYEPKPGGSMTTGVQASGQSSQPSSQQPTPPVAAITACKNGSNGNSCSFSGQQGIISGNCKMPPGESSLACIPSSQ